MNRTMQTPVRTRDRLRFEARGVALFLLAIFFFLALPVLVRLPPKVLIALATAAIVIAAGIVAVGHWRRRRHGMPSDLGWRFARTLAVCVLVLGSLTGLPVYWLITQEATHPLLLPQATLSNGEKTVVFQGMVHVGSEGFYKSLVYDLENALANGYKLYYEGVQRSTPEADAWFNSEFAGGKDLGTNYKALAMDCGLTYQLEYFQLLATDMRDHPDRHLTADVNTRQLMDEYERLIATDKSFSESVRTKAGASAAEVPAFDPLASLLRWTEASPSHHTLGGILCRGFFTLVLNRNIEHKSEDAPMDRVLVDFRNRHLADAILGDTSRKIFVTYGARHFLGVFHLLKEKDPRWKIESVKWLRPISTPENYEKELVLD